jgi:two-component system chemotaxis response regulator CheB
LRWGSRGPKISSMAAHDIVVIGASSGGVEAVSKVVKALPADFPAALFVVIHLSPLTPSILPEILARASRLPAVHPRDGDPIKPGVIHVAPPDRHLLLTPDAIEVTAGPRENYHRPSIDVLFRSAASFFAERVIGAVLTGALDDGASGLWTIIKQGGIGIVQDPSTAWSPGMPTAAIEVAAPQHVLPLAAIGPKLVELVEQRRLDARATRTREPPDRGTSLQRLGGGDIDHQSPDAASPITCPECGGALAESSEGRSVRFRCFTGHTFSPDGLMEGKLDTVERALWTAVRSLDESTRVARRLAERARTGGGSASRILRYDEKIRELETSAGVLRELFKRRRRA